MFKVEILKYITIRCSLLSIDIGLKTFKPHLDVMRLYRVTYRCVFFTVDCVWNEWSQWQKCNLTCGGGWQQRTRTQEEELYGGEPCSGTFDDWRPCNERPCPSIPITLI